MPSSERTILLPIYNGARAKSFFYTDIYSGLISAPNLKLVIAIPPDKDDLYKKEFGAPNVIFESIALKPEDPFGQKLNRAAFNLMPTSTVRGKQTLFRHRYGKLYKYYLLRAANYILGPIPLTRFVIRLLDRSVSLDKDVVKVLKKYNPDLVIIPDIVFGPDRLFLRASKRLGFNILGMARSWDNLTSKGFVQVLPDKLIVYSNRMIDEAVKYAGMKREDVFMGGSPQFDGYFKPAKKSREEFLKGLGIDINSKIVVCAPFFDRYLGSAIAMINELTKAIDDGRLPANTHIIVRNRPATPPIENGLLHASKHLTMTEPTAVKFNSPNPQTPGEDNEWSKEDILLLDNTLRYSDVVINTVSTLSIDAVSFDKPVINVRFDADPKTPPEHSVNVMLPNHDHYRTIEASGGVKLVRSMDEMISAINAYLKNSKLDAQGREKLRREQIVITDGNAGQRTAEFIIQTLDSLRKKR